MSIGKTALPVIRSYYGHTAQDVSLAALEAGARLEDELVCGYLEPITRLPDTPRRRRVANILRHMPNSLRGVRLLQRLLDDSETEVRIDAYESLADISDPVIRRTAIDGPEPDRGSSSCSIWCRRRSRWFMLPRAACRAW